MGTRQARLMTATRPIGMSCSVRGKAPPWPPRRAREAARAEPRPEARGAASFARVQMAATPIAPAPIKRTWWLQTALATSAAAPAAGCRAESSGTATPQAITSPTSMAIPAQSPMRCPTPNRARDMPRSNPLTEAPVRK